MAHDRGLCVQLWWDRESWLLVPGAGLRGWDLPKPPRRRGAGGRRGGGRQGCVQRALAVPSPPSSLPRVRGEGAGAGCLVSVLAGGPSTRHDDKEGRKTRNGPFVLVVNRYSVPYKMDFYLPFWFCAVIIPVASMESLLIHAGVKGGIGLWCVGLKGQQQS